jgi:catechol 2,3-dioxygenase-like lactoylglutathione lyase family enzyme
VDYEPTMRILGLEWVGTRTMRFRETVAFFEETLGLPIGQRETDFVRLDLPDESCVEVFGPADRDHLYFTTGPAVGFLVEDLDAARHDLSRHGIELLSTVGGEAGDYRWQHFRGPDGYVYEVVEFPGRQGGGPPRAPLGITHLAWVGTRTARYEETRTFFGEVLGLEVVEDLPELTEYRLANGAAVEVFLPDSPLDHRHFTTGPVPGFGVQDVDAAVAILRARRVPLLQEKLQGLNGWAHFRAPDGCVYEVKGPRHAA